MGNLRDAEGVLQESIQRDAKVIEAHQLLSEVLRQEGKSEEATKEQHLADLLQLQQSFKPEPENKDH